MHKREREVERRGGGAPPRSLRDSKACGLGEASAPSLAPLCPLDRAQLEHVCDEVVPRLLLPHLPTAEPPLSSGRSEAVAISAAPRLPLALSVSSSASGNLG